MKKYFALFLLSLFLLSSAGCTYENKASDAKRIALEDFGMDEIWVVCNAVPGINIPQEISRYGLYVLGSKDKKERLILVPARTDQAPFEMDWPLEHSFREIMEKLNSTEKGEICTKEEYPFVEFAEGSSLKEYLPDDVAEQADKEFIILYFDYAIVQIEGEIFIYENEEQVV